MRVNNQRCLHCGACVGSCPTNSMFLHETAFVEILPTCIECERCVMICPVGSIARVSKPAGRPVHAPVREVGV